MGGGKAINTSLFLAVGVIYMSFLLFCATKRAAKSIDGLLAFGGEPKTVLASMYVQLALRRLKHIMLNNHAVSWKF